LADDGDVLGFADDGNALGIVEDALEGFIVGLSVGLLLTTVLGISVGL